MDYPQEAQLVEAGEMNENHHYSQATWEWRCWSPKDPLLRKGKFMENIAKSEDSSDFQGRRNKESAEEVGRQLKVEQYKGLGCLLFYWAH